jgi:hypothetical protein
LSRRAVGPNDSLFRKFPNDVGSEYDELASLSKRADDSADAPNTEEISDKISPELYSKLKKLIKKGHLKLKQTTRDERNLRILPIIEMS